MAYRRALCNFAGLAVTAPRNSSVVRRPITPHGGRIAALGAALPSSFSLNGMDYRKIGQALHREGDRAPGRAIGRDLGQHPLGELGLTGLVERLALAIQRAGQRR